MSTPPTLAEATAVWARIGLLGFGGPAGQIALMHRELVDQRRWISEDRFLHALNFCMLLPGPEAQQLATYVGWLLHGWRGGLVAGVLFVIPGLAIIIALSAAYALFADLAWLTAIFFGLKAAVLAIVIEATLRVGSRALRTRNHAIIAALAFIALFAFGVPFPLVIAVAALAGFIGARLHPSLEPLPATAPVAAPSVARSIGTILLWGGIWLLPLVLIIPLLGWNNVLTDLWLFFSQMAVVTFGGAYAVLSYVAQEAVSSFGWLQPGEMIDGLALAETTPGPLVLVLSFVGFMAAFRAPLGLDPLTMGILGGLLTAWVTFVPCFLWIFLGAPYIERLRTNRALSGALAAVTAAIVGVILNLALWFALHILFRETIMADWGPIHLTLPNTATLDLRATLLAILAAISLFTLRLGILPTLAITGSLSLLASLIWP